jgi:hypothetical protein
MRGTAIDLEVEIYATKLTRQAHEHQCMELGRSSENSAYRLRNLWSKTMKLANETSL